MSDSTQIGNALDEIRDLLDIQQSDPKLGDEFAWFVGANIGDNDCFEQFINEGRWENGYDTKFTELVKSINVGDKIAIKSSYTRKNGLPFNASGKVVGVMAIKAIGVVTENLGDGRNIKVAWNSLDSIKEWYGKGVLRSTIHKICAKDGITKRLLLQFTFNDKPQDYSICEEQYMDDDENSIEIITSIGENVLFYGVPGAGKSHEIDSRVDKETTERVVFHPDYTYSDFIGQILPRLVKDEDDSSRKKLNYVFEAGPFTRMVKRALNDPERMYYLVIEEINRGNAPAIFGDVFQLLDRDDNGASKYKISNYDMAEEIYGDGLHQVQIPANLTIYATMNTSDQNVFTLDTAFQRRWQMHLIKNDIKAAKHADVAIGGSQVTWGMFAEVINDEIVSFSENMGSSEDKRLGAYFVGIKDLGKERFSEKVLKYLWDDAFKMDRTVIFDDKMGTLDAVIETVRRSDTQEDVLKAVMRTSIYQKMLSPKGDSIENPSDDITNTSVENADEE